MARGHDSYMVYQGSNSGDQRVFVSVEVDLADQDNFLFAYIHDLDATGIFIRTTNPQAPGTRLNMRFLPRGAEAPIEFDGQVIWVNPYRPDDSNNLSPGMGIRFLDLTREQRLRLIALIKCIAYLDDDAQSIDEQPESIIGR